MLLFADRRASFDPSRREVAVTLPLGFSEGAPVPARRGRTKYVRTGTKYVRTGHNTSRTHSRTVGCPLLEGGPVVLETPREEEDAERQGDDHQTLQESLHRFHLGDSIPQF